MAISPIYSNTAGNGQVANSSASLDMSEFLKLLTTQLSSQDPLNPTSDSDFFAQLAQMGTVQGVDALQSSLNVSQAAALMGKTVTAAAIDPATGASGTVEGTVSRLTIQNGQYILDVTQSDGSVVQVLMSNVSSVANPQVPKK